ncbi:MAG TPA: hypothetical protein VFV99_00785 [Kofleriaceae bacterium]|nr:hypothetical protein [Kofleriaceae bacterium]
MRRALLLVGFAACSSPAAIEVDAAMQPMPDASAADVPANPMGFGDLSGMCGVLAAADLTAPMPMLVRDTFTFARQFVDPTDRPLLTTGGQKLAETPNAGGSSGLSEVFAYEQLARCETAALLKTETEIVYDTTGKITDLEVSLDGHKIGVSVTRAVAYPFGSTYTLTAATTLITRKLSDIQMSTANVSAQDRWDKQILAILAWDGTAADTMAQAWEALDGNVKADTIVVLTTTDGEDLFIYSNM